MSKRSGLGSGLDALLSGASEPGGGMREAPIHSIRPNPHQPRTQFDEAALDELAASIREHGIIQPLIVSEREEGQYELIAGERRWRAAKRAGITRVPVIVREASPQQLLELALIENVQRADLNPLEEAQAYETLKTEFGLTDEVIAQRVGRQSRTAITNIRRLLRLPREVKAAILAGQISGGHGRALLQLETKEQQLAALKVIVDEGLNVRAAERLGEHARSLDGDVAHAAAALRGKRTAQPRNQPDTRAAAPAQQEDLQAEDREITRELERILGTPASIHRTGRVLRVTIEFHTEEKLQEFFDLLNSAT